MAAHDDVLKTIIAEGASEGEEGMYAIASVMVNRARTRGKSLLDIVNQPSQFSGRWRTDLETFVQQQPASVQAAAQRALQRAQASPIPGVDHYVTNALYRSSARPSWVTRLKKDRVVGRHTFMRSSRLGGVMTPSAIAFDTVDPTEETIRGQNRLVLAAGLQPLSPSEIERFLERLTPPTVVAGVRPSPPDRDRQERAAISSAANALRFNRAPATGAPSGAAAAFQGSTA